MNNEQITRELELMRERYLKLVDIHGQIRKENSLLEERILSIVETYSNEKTQFEQELIDAKQRIIHLQDTVNELEIEKQRYKDDCNLAVRLLHRNPNEFLSTSTELIQEQWKNKNESTSTNQSQHSMVIPTFPPTYATPLPLFNTTIPSSSGINPTTANDNLRLAESLFKTNTVHRYPSTHYICSNCHQTIKCSDVSVQTSLDDHHTTSRTRVVSLTASSDGLSGGTTRVSLDHGHMTVKEYQSGRLSQDTSLPSHSIPQMHDV